MPIMPCQLRRILISSASLVALGVASAGAAQTAGGPGLNGNAPAGDNSSASPSATTVAQASPAAQSGGLEEITVTARKRSEKLQDIASSVSALSTTDLARRFDSDVRDFANSSPNIIIDDTQQGPGGVAAVYIRGIGVADVEKSVDPAVGIVFDDVYLGQSSGSLLKAIDIDRVEVLRGPQGTVFGRNATGGVINIARSRPTDELTGKARVTFGNFDTLNVEGVVSDGIAPHLAFKLTGAYERSDGYIYNSTLGQNGQRSEFFTVGGELLFTPTDRFEVSINYDRQQTRQDPPQLVAVNRPTDLFCAAYQQCSPAPGVPTSGNRYVSVANGPLGYNAHFDMDLAIVKMKYNISDNVSLQYILGYQHTGEVITQDFDASPLTLYHTDRPARWSQITHEFRLTKSNGPLTFVAGAYLWDSHYTINLKNYIGFAGPPLLTSAQDVYQTNTSEAAFGEADYRITDKLKLTVGARYTHDHKSSIVNDLPVKIYGSDVEQNPVAVLPGTIVMTAPAEKGWSKFTPKASLSYDFTRDVMAYALFSRGYRGGGFNGRPATLNAATIPYDPETVDNYEVGVKSEFLEHRLRFNASVFVMKYTNMQQDLDVPAPGTSTGRENRTINAASANLNGVEVELLARPMSGLTLHGNLGYLDAKYNKFVGDIYSTGTPVDATFLKIRRAPKWTWDTGVTYETAAGRGTAWATAEVHYIGPHEITFLNNPNLRNGSQYLVDASLNYKIANTSVSLFVKNLADQKGWTIGYDVQGIWSYAAARPPRTFGIALTQSF